MSLMSKFREQTNKNVEKFGRREVSTTLLTGIPTLDYFNGKITIDDVTREPKLCLGVNCGKSILVSGPTSSGKSMFAYQLAYNLVKPYDGDILIMDYENAFEDQRFLSVPGVEYDWYRDHVEVRSESIYSETLMELGLELYNLKKEHADELMIDDPNGTIDPITKKPYKIYKPTVIIMDSLAFNLPKNYADTDDAKLSGQTSAGRISQVNGEIFKRLTQLFREVNIILITVQHLSTAFNPTGMPKAPIIKGMKTDEHIAGGKSVTYISDTLFIVQLKDRLEAGSKDNPFKDVTGYIAEFRMLKSRNSPAHRSFSLVFSQQNGFDPILSMFRDLQQDGVLEGKGVYRLPNYPEKTFRASTFKELYNTDEVFRDKFNECYHEYGVNKIHVSENIQRQFVSEAEIMEELENGTLSDKFEE